MTIMVCAVLQEAGQPDINIITEKVAFEVRAALAFLGFVTPRHLQILCVLTTWQCRCAGLNFD